MLKCSKNSEGTAELEEALATMLDIIKSVNDSMHQIAITGFEARIMKCFIKKQMCTKCLSYIQCVQKWSLVHYAVYARSHGHP